MSFMSIDKEMLPMKGHYFLFNAGTAPLVPYLPTYAKQLGFSLYIVGIIYTFLPIFGLIAKPVFGAIADRYEKHKLVFILFQILTITAFSGLYFIPDSSQAAETKLSCGDGESFFSICPKANSSLGQCAVDKVIAINETTKCYMSCSMDNPFMWQTVCEHWRVPQYCYTNKSELHFSATLPLKKIKAVGDCAYFPLGKAKMSDGLEYVPHCSDKVDESLKTSCSLNCPHVGIISLLSSTQNAVNFFCEKNITYFNSCSHKTGELQSFVNGIENDLGNVDCNVVCNMDKPSKWLDLCLTWGADETTSCHPSASFLPNNIHFTGTVPLQKTIQQGGCIFFNMKYATFPDGSVHSPDCPKSARPHSHFHSNCSTWCENSQVNELLTSHSVATEKESDTVNYQRFSIFFFLMVLNWVGMAVVVSIADAICFEMLGSRLERYGHQRLWGSMGWGIFSLLSGFLIDQFSQNEDHKNYLVAFILMFILLLLDIMVSYKLKYKQKSIAVNIFRKVSVLFTNLQTCHFFLWIILVGMCTGLLWQYLFWYLEDLAQANDCTQQRWIKTLQGLVGVLQCFLGELPFFFFSGRILKKIGHIHSMSLVLLGFGIRFILYSLLTNPWWVLPIECLQGITFGMLYATMASYASIIAPKGTEATIQGLVGAIFEGIGTSIGSLIGGVLYGSLGGALVFRIFGCAALAACLINVLISRFCFKKPETALDNPNQEYSSIIRYAAPNDALDMLSEHDIN